MSDALLKRDKGQRGFQHLRFCKSNPRVLHPPPLYCGSGLLLWIFHDEHLKPCPERYFKPPLLFFFFGCHKRQGYKMSEVWSHPVVHKLKKGLKIYKRSIQVELLTSLNDLTVALCWGEKSFQSDQGASFVSTNWSVLHLIGVDGRIFLD